MFTGLVQAIGSIVEARSVPTGMGLTLEVSAWSRPMQPALEAGESVAVNGCCLTLARLATSPRGIRLGFDVIHETLRVTTLGRFAAGGRVNLERAATPTTLLGGHFVQGHIDAIARVVEVVNASGERRVRCALPRDLMRYVSPRGSISIDGVSLTVAALDDEASTLDVCLIPETLERTTLAELGRDAEVNVEVDCLAKMVERSARFRG